MGPALFWGLFLILIGLALIVKFVFNLDIPVFRIAVALFLIMIGIRLLIRDGRIFWFRQDENDILFRDTVIKGKELREKEYNVIFGRSVFDLRDIDTTDLPKNLHINTVFGSTRVMINKDIPLIITGDAVFAGARLSSGNSTVFGEMSFKSSSFKPDKDYLQVKADVIFGAFELKSD